MADDDEDNNVAIKALCLLIESGNVSIDEVRAAVQEAHGHGSQGATHRPAAPAHDEDENDNQRESEKQPTGDSQHGSTAANDVTVELGVEAEALPSKKGGEETPKTTVEHPKRGEPKTPAEKYRTRHVALQISYDGTTFTGYAEHMWKDSDNSVEKSLFAALEQVRLLVAPAANGLLAPQDPAAAREQEEQGTVDGKRVMWSKYEQLTQSGRTTSQYTRCGRTDRGVHAHGQIVALRLKSAFPLSVRTLGETADILDADGMVVPGEVLKEESLPQNSLDDIECRLRTKHTVGSPREGHGAAALQRKRIAEYDYPKLLNNVLPPSIRVLGWCPVAASDPPFSARFSCSRGTYRYFFPRRRLDLAAMAEGMRHLMGRHDGRNLCKMNREQILSPESDLVTELVRGTVASPQRVYVVTSGAEEDAPSASSVAEAKEAPHPHDMCHVEISGRAFLWHQVRCIMSILFFVGRRLEAPALVRQLLDISTHPAKPSYEMASETALVLQECRFEQLRLARTVRSLWGVTQVWEERWERHAVAAARANDALESVKHDTEVRWSDVVEFVEQTAYNRRRKEEKRMNEGEVRSDGGEIGRELERQAPPTGKMSWSSAIEVIQNVIGMCPYLPNGGQKVSAVHVPLLERSKGTTYEEKIQSIQGEHIKRYLNKPRPTNSTTKRKGRDEENQSKKRKTAEKE